ncbi:MAG: beta-N-acetylhexosaminidase [Paracoccaceae bacterium]
MAGAAILGCLGTGLSQDEKQFFRDADPWGFIVFARNLETPDQIRALTQEMRDCVGRDAPILIDQEGGRVQRLRAPNWMEWLPALDQMKATKPGQSQRAMWIRYRLIADELRDLGIDVNCAPMLDVATDQVHEVIQNRCYGRDAQTVALAGRAVADGLLAGGVLPILKHIPGHGRPVTDSHLELPHTDAATHDLKAVDFAAFKVLADLPMAMTGHVVYSAFDSENCATLSPTIINLIRDEIGFDGLLMTDDISMNALSGNFTNRSRAALDAGCDLILHCHGHMHEMVDVMNAAGTLSGKAAKRADRALGYRSEVGEIDRAALLAELADLLMIPVDGAEPKQ